MNQESVTVRHYDTECELLPIIQPLYAEIYGESPYEEGPADVEYFADTLWPKYITQPGFIAVLAHADGCAVGFAFGYTLTAGTGWWRGLIQTTPADLTVETGTRTFAIIELAVRMPYRRRGIARRMHDALLKDRVEERATLLVRPEARGARSAYLSWGYQQVGPHRPAPNGPLYIAMLRDASMKFSERHL